MNIKLIRYSEYMDLKSEFQKQGILGNITMFLTLLGAFSSLASLFNLLSRDVFLSIMFIIMCMTSIITVITRHQYAKLKDKMDSSNLILVESLQKERLRAEKLKSAYIFAHAAYQKAVGMTTRNIQYDGNVNIVNEGSHEHLQSMDHHDMYMKSEIFAREVGEEV